MLSDSFPTPATPFLAELTALIGAVQIQTPREIFFAARPIDLGPPDWPVAFPPPLPPLLTGLYYRLYREGYCARYQGAPAPDSAPDGPDADFIRSLEAANPGKTRMDAGWHVVGPGPDGRFWLQKGGVARTAWPGAFLTHAGPNQAPQAGQPASIHWPHESRQLQPGTYFVIGAAVPDDVADAPIMRFYWHVQAGGAPRLLAALAAALNRFQIPFRFKCPAHPANYSRRDAAVLYISRRDYALVARLLAPIYYNLQACMQPDTPLFTRRLAPGLAFAEDPGTEESFGQHRCRLLAGGLWRAHELQAMSSAERLEIIRKHFAETGIDLDRPHLNATTREDYPWPPA
ncbi:MAG TPA: T3SS effector HopA1 family protein [Chloroflexia bacterium]